MKIVRLCLVLAVVSALAGLVAGGGSRWRASRAPPGPRLRSSTMKMPSEFVFPTTRAVPASHSTLSRWESLKAFLTLR